MRRVVPRIVKGWKRRGADSVAAEVAGVPGEMAC